MSESKAFCDEPCPGCAAMRDFTNKAAGFWRMLGRCPVCYDVESGLNSGRVIVAVTA